MNKVHPETGTKFTLEGEQSSPLKVNKVHPHKEVNNDSNKESHNNSAATAAHDGELQIEIKKETKAERIDKEALEALNHLNTLCRRDFQPTPENLKFPRGRLQGGAALDTLKLIVEWAAATWKGQQWNGKSAEFYWRPATLFQAEKFDHYRQQAEMWKQAQNGKNGAASTGDIKAMRASGIYNQK